MYNVPANYTLNDYGLRPPGTLRTRYRPSRGRVRNVAGLAIDPDPGKNVNHDARSGSVGAASLFSVH